MSNYTKAFLYENGINWWKALVESSELNPIENVWASMKYCLAHEYKPKNLEGLIDGIKIFLKGMSPEVCWNYIYIGH